MIPSDANSITFEMSKAFLFGGINSSWVDQYGGRDNVRFCLLGYNGLATYLLENCTNTPTFLSDFYDGYPSSVNILDHIDNHSGAALLESAILDTIWFLIDESLQSQEHLHRTRLIITTLQDRPNDTESDVCKFHKTIRKVEMSQIHHILLHFSDNTTMNMYLNDSEYESQSSYDIIRCFDTNEYFEVYDADKQSYYLANLTEIINDKFDNFDSAMSHLATKFWELYERKPKINTLDFTSYVTFQELGSQLLPAFLAATGYGQINNTLWLLSGNVTIKNQTESTFEPTFEPTPEPTPDPTPQPTYKPTPKPTRRATRKPTPKPTRKPTGYGWRRRSLLIDSTNQNDESNVHDITVVEDSDEGGYYNTELYRRRLGRRKKKKSSNATVSAVAIDTTTGDAVLVSDNTAENVEVNSAGTSSTEEYISFPGSFYQFDVFQLLLFKRDNYPISDILQPCVVSDSERFTFLIGGYDNMTLETTNITQMYDELLDSWTILPEMNTRRVLHSCHYFQNLIIVFGGCGNNIDCVVDGRYDSIDPQNDNTGDSYFETFEYLDLNNIGQGWVTVNNIELDIPRIGARSITDYFDNVWIIGGFNGNHTLRSIELLKIKIKPSNVRFDISDEFANLLIGRAAMGVGQNTFNDTGFGCVIISGGKYGPKYNNNGYGYQQNEYRNLEILDNQEFLCYPITSIHDQCPIVQCENDPCDCNEITNCKTCTNGYGCTKCKRGYFRKDSDYQCTKCQELLGKDCLKCEDFIGCTRCDKGQLVYDSACDLYKCSTQNKRNNNHGGWYHN